MGQKKSGIVRPERLKWHGHLAAWVIHKVISLLSATIRYSMDDVSRKNWESTPGPVIFAIWHNRLALCLPVHRKLVLRRQNSSRRMAALVSASKDGALLARILELSGVQPVRGSSSRRGAQALLELTTWAREGGTIAITPDGPRGPAYKVQEGIIRLAQVCQVPILPGGWNLSSKISLKSWDRFQIPLPFTRCELRFNTPIVVAPDSDEATREKHRVELEESLNSLIKD
jgi:lysophospholipid acyltransferase (LPLAT)-like uncharacterized protein